MMEMFSTKGVNLCSLAISTTKSLMGSDDNPLKGHWIIFDNGFLHAADLISSRH